jgi:diadenosine tetraphosphate (Ap4A) HIT family hydrolase
VVEPTELSADEAARFFAELLHVGRAIERVFGPVKMNYDILGNSVPHLHVHVIPRYADDPRPEWPFPFPVRSRHRSPMRSCELTRSGCARQRNGGYGPTEAQTE